MSTINVRGGSTSSLAEVDNNALRTRRNSEWDVALDAGLAFSWSSASFAHSSAHDTIIAVENNSGKYDLKIRKIVAIAGNAATEVVVFTASGVTMTNGNAIVGVNLNQDSGQLAASLATAIGDEQGNTEQADGYPTKVITGRVAITSGVTFDLDGTIIVPNDHLIGVNFTSTGDDSYATIWGYFVPR